MLSKLRKIVRSMNTQEKIKALLLAAVFITSLVQLVVSQIHSIPAAEAGTVVEGFVGHVHTLNPLFTDLSDADRDISHLIFSGLVKYDPVAKNFLPDLASKIERSGNGKTLTFTINEAAQWHDGQPVTAEDVVFTIHDLIQHPDFKNTLLKEAFAGVQVKATDPHTVVFTLEKSNSYFISQLTIGILPKHIFAGAKPDALDRDPHNQKPIGSGPYKLASFKLDAGGDVVDLMAFNSFYGQKPLITNLRFLTFPDEKSLFAARTALHTIAKVSSTNNDELTKDGFKLIPYSLNQFTAFSFNTDQTPFDSDTVRRAFTLYLDKDSLVLPGEKRIDSIGLGDPQKGAFITDKAKAEKILDEAGWKKGSDGVRRDDKNQELTVRILTMERIPDELVTRLLKNWEGIGAKITQTKADTSDQVIQFVEEGRYDLLISRQSLGYNRDLFPLLHSSQISGLATPDSEASFGLNFSRFRSFQTDGLTEAIRKETNPADKQKLLEKLSGILTEQIPMLFISTPIYSYAVPAGTTGFPDQVTFDFHADRLSILPYLSVH